jgi:hypothetical protein
MPVFRFLKVGVKVRPLDTLNGKASMMRHWSQRSLFLLLCLPLVKEIDRYQFAFSYQQSVGHPSILEELFHILAGARIEVCLHIDLAELRRKFHSISNDVDEDLGQAAIINLDGLWHVPADVERYFDLLLLSLPLEDAHCFGKRLHNIIHLWV